jgi:hypothetical protein
MIHDPTPDTVPGRVSANFVWVASICALLTVLTTIGVHWVPRLWESAMTFDAQVQLRNNRIYVGQHWMILVHCVLVVISMAAIPMLLNGTARLVALLGFGSFIMFAFVELLRTSLSIFAVNRAWRSGYEMASDDSTRATFRSAIETFSGINDALFFLFFAAFTVGLFCYGLALLQTNGVDHKIAFLFLVWALLNLPGLIAFATAKESIGSAFGWVGPYFQPVARLLIGAWLWSVSKRIVADKISRATNLST